MDEQPAAGFVFAADEQSVRARYGQALVTRNWFASVIVAVEELQVGVYAVRGSQLLVMRATPSDNPALRLLGAEEAVATLRRWQAMVMGVWN